MAIRTGIYAAAITPIVDGSPNIDKLVGYCRYLLTSGCDGVAPLGTTGECNSLPADFRLAAPKAFAKAGIPSDRVVFGTGACSVEDAIRFTRASVEKGYPNVLVVPPFFYKGPGEDGLYAYYSRIIEGVSSDDLRIYLYHFPQMSMVPITLALVTRLRDAYGSVIAGLKDSSGDIETSRMFATSVADFAVFPSNEGALLEALDFGAAGIISATANVSAQLAQETLKAQGADKVAMQVHLKNVRAAIQSVPLISAIKQVVSWRGGDDSLAELLPPLERLSVAQNTVLRAAVDKLDTASDYSFIPA